MPIRLPMIPIRLMPYRYSDEQGNYEESRFGGNALGGYVAVLRARVSSSTLMNAAAPWKKVAWRINRLRKNPAEAFRLGVLLDSERGVIERHRHRYEVSPKFVDLLDEFGLIFSGYHRREDGTKLMEFVELPEHPFFVATQAHPEFKSRLEQPAPLFYGFVEAVVTHKRHELVMHRLLKKASEILLCALCACAPVEQTEQAVDGVPVNREMWEWSTHITDRGKSRAQVRAGSFQQVSKDEPARFSDGVRVVFFNSQGDTVSTLGG